MSDRNDPSQFPTDQTNDNDLSFFGDTSISNHQLQRDSEGVYATPDELVGYSGIGVDDDYFTRNPGNYNTKPRGKYTIAVSRKLPGATGPIVTAPAHVTGWSVRETTGLSSALIRFRDGTDIGNPDFLTVSLAPGESARDFLPLPIETTRAVFLEIVTGAVDGNLFTVETRNV
jgi:hypothetical protein